MSKIFEYHNGIVSVTDEGSSLPEVKEAKKLTNWNDIREYVYWNYDRDSMYHNNLPGDRVKIVHSDKFNHLDAKGYKALGKDCRLLIKKLEILQYTSNERLMDGIEGKIEEYLEYWNKTKITEDNHKLVSETIERAEALLKIKERIAKLVGKESEVRRMGGGQNTLIESMTE